MVEIPGKQYREQAIAALKEIDAMKQSGKPSWPERRASIRVDMLWKLVRRLGDIDLDSCWEWRSSPKDNGYGSIWFQGRVQKASRVSFQLFVSEIPTRICVCHHCDNPPCTNPYHLFLGTKQQNKHDAINKGRAQPGPPPSEINPGAKLTPDEVRYIRRINIAELLAERFNVHPATIRYIRGGVTWKSQTPDE